MKLKGHSGIGAERSGIPNVLGSGKNLQLMREFMILFVSISEVMSPKYVGFKLLAESN